MHTSRETCSWKREHRINAINWPPQFPDLNVIENVWRTVKIKPPKRVSQIKAWQDLTGNVLEICTSLTPTCIKSLYLSLPKRIRAVFEANGCITKYRKFRVRTFFRYIGEKKQILTMLILAKVHHVSNFVAFNLAHECRLPRKKMYKVGNWQYFEQAL